MGSMDTERGIKKHDEQVPNFDNVDKRDQYLERYNLPKLMQREICNLNRLASIQEIKSIISNHPKRMHQAQIYWFTGEFYKIFIVKLTPILYKLLQKIQTREHFLI